MSNKLIVTLITVGIIAVGTVLAVFFAKGYTFSTKDGKIVGTGIVSVTSSPDGASVYIDGHLTTATNTTVSQLKPRNYNVKIIKEGFIPWEKNVDVVEGLVTEIKATLFPALPTMYPLTLNGVVDAELSADGQKLAFTVPLSGGSHTKERGGVWVWTMSSQPLSFTRGAEPHQIIISTPSLDFSKAKLTWSPDSTQVLATLQDGEQPGDSNTRNFLLPIDRQTATSDLKDITPTVAGTLAGWQDDVKAKEEVRFTAIKDLGVKKVASDGAVIKWSPDETKFILGSKVYDLATNQLTKSKPTNSQNKSANPQNSPVTLSGNQQYNLPEAKVYSWLPDSRHIVLVQEDKIAIAEIDGGNVAEIYAGKFNSDFVFAWPDSSKLVVLTSFATTTASTPNLFGINLK
ncbi:PEGA domain-containing protein [Candidatus Daviesbacteria bacterium]|nr:PEGA domain-containing protein [Candidatus Daviesbacteria bacterium]